MTVETMMSDSSSSANSSVSVGFFMNEMDKGFVKNIELKKKLF